MESLILKASFFTLDDILSILVSMGKILIALLIIIRINLFSFDLCFHSRKYKRIKKKEIVENKDIPNLDAFYINTLNSFNKDFKPIYFMLNDISVLKYLLLKWYKDGAIRIENNGIVFSNVGFENSCEQHIYTFFRMISKDNYLSIKRLKKWASSNYKSYIKTYKLPKQVIIKSLVRNGHIDSKHGFTDDVIYEDSKKLYSFKLFIMKIIKSEDRVDFDFYLWYEYLLNYQIYLA